MRNRKQGLIDRCVASDTQGNSIMASSKEICEEERRVDYPAEREILESRVSGQVIYQLLKTTFKAA